MAGGGVDRLGMARRRAVAPAVVRRAEMGAALQHLARNPDGRLAGIIALRLRPAARILRHAAGLRRIGLMGDRPEIGGPLPDIADHVVETVAVRREAPDRRGPGPAVVLGVLERAIPLPDI